VTERPRRNARKRVVLEATIISNDGTQVVRVRDLSREGVQIACDDPPQQGCEVIFCRGKVFAAAQVAWREERRAGLEFYQPLDPARHGAEWG